LDQGPAAPRRLARADTHAPSRRPLQARRALSPPASPPRPPLPLPPPPATRHPPPQDFFKLFPEKFQNKTNGVTPRRWLAFCNPKLAELITAKLGSDEWIKNTYELKGLRKFADDKEHHKVGGA
jgi:hypothetical protein